MQRKQSLLTMKLSLAVLVVAFPAYSMSFQVNVDTSDEMMKHVPKMDKRLTRQNDQVDKYLRKTGLKPVHHNRVWWQVGNEFDAAPLRVFSQKLA